MVVYIVLRHPDNPEQLWVNSWIAGNRLIESITTDANVAGQCQRAQRADEYVYVHRLVYGENRATVVSKAKVKDVQRIGAGTPSHYVLFKEQVEVGLEPIRSAQQGDRSYCERPVDVEPPVRPA
jgi:hypothetical protein